MYTCKLDMVHVPEFGSSELTMNAWQCLTSEDFFQIVQKCQFLDKKVTKNEEPSKIDQNRTKLIIPDNLTQTDKHNPFVNNRKRRTISTNKEVGSSQITKNKLKKL